MYETELLLSGIGIGLLLAYLIIPKILIPKLKERFSKEDYSPSKSKNDYKCPSCHSGGRHRNDCPNNPKNKVKT
jgi:hypothetical protein